jgi:hypothetical protein
MDAAEAYEPTEGLTSKQMKVAMQWKGFWLSKSAISPPPNNLEEDFKILLKFYISKLSRI